MNTKHGSRDTQSVKGKTNWAALKAMPDSTIKFTQDAPRTSAEDWADAVAHHGLPLPVKKEQIALRVDADVVTWFRSQGAGWQTRMNAVLKAYSKTLSRQGVTPDPPHPPTPAPQRRGGGRTQIT